MHCNASLNLGRPSTRKCHKAMDIFLTPSLSPLGNGNESRLTADFGAFGGRKRIFTPAWPFDLLRGSLLRCMQIGTFGDFGVIGHLA